MNLDECVPYSISMILDECVPHSISMILDECVPHSISMNLDECVPHSISLNLDECVPHSISMNLDECVLFVLFSLLFIMFHSNASYKPYTLQADRKEKNETKIDIKINATEAKKKREKKVTLYTLHQDLRRENHV